MYDAVMLYAMAVGSNSSERLNGRHFADVMMNMSFDGMSGRVELDEHGDLKESISAMNYVVESGGTMRGRRIGVYDAPSRRYLPVHNSTVVWPGNVHAIPADMAALPADQGFDTKWILVGASVSAVVVVAGVTILVRKRQAHLQAIMLQLFTEVPPYPLDFCRDSCCHPNPPFRQSGLFTCHEATRATTFMEVT
jgi:hypothetical protein